jgi:hypothetical protein
MRSHRTDIYQYGCSLEHRIVFDTAIIDRNVLGINAGVNQARCDGPLHFRWGRQVVPDIAFNADNIIWIRYLTPGVTRIFGTQGNCDGIVQHLHDRSAVQGAVSFGRTLIPDQHHSTFPGCLAGGPGCQGQSKKASEDGTGTGADKITTCDDMFFLGHDDFFLSIRRLQGPIEPQMIVNKTGYWFYIPGIMVFIQIVSIVLYFIYK